VQVLNATVRSRNYWQVVSDAQAVSLQVSIVLASIEVFLFLHYQWGSPKGVLALTISVILAGQLLVRWAAGASAMLHSQHAVAEDRC
jgi:hypothetical protein